MPDLNIRHFRLAAAAVLAAAMSLTALVAVAPAASATTLGTKSIILGKLTDVSPPDTFAISPAMLDSSVERAYVIDRTHKTVIAYDTSGGTPTVIKNLSAGLPDPSFLALNPTTHELFVLQRNVKNLVIIDVNPGSPSEFGTKATISTGLTFAQHIEVDSHTNRAYLLDDIGTNLLVVDRASGSLTPIDIGAGQKDLALDETTHVAYVTSRAASEVAVIAPDLTKVVAPLPFASQGIEASNGIVLMASLHDITRFDPSTWVPMFVSSPTLSRETTIRIDVERGLAMVAYTQSADATIQVLRTADLGLDGALTIPQPITGFEFDTSSDRVTTATSGSAGAKFTMYSVTDRPKPSVERVGGADRYAVSAAISAKTYAPGSPVAYVASGAVFTDALSASAAAGAQGGGVLLVQKNAIPPVIATELSRLKPQQIIVLGGTDTIDPSVETSLKAYSATVTRVGGADRYAVSAAVSKGAFGPMRPVAYIASGAVFPDALSGSAGAGRQGGPVLLVTKDGIPDVVQAELTRLAPAKIVVLGGTNTISDSVVTALGATAPTTRIGGADRFAVSAGVSANAFPAETPIAYVASGANFPDALSGGAAAIADGAPVLLVNPDTLPASIDAELDRLLPTRIIILGGTNSVSDAVATAIANH